MVVMKYIPPPSKTSMRARFRGWWEGGAEEQSTIIKNEGTRARFEGGGMWGTTGNLQSFELVIIRT